MSKFYIRDRRILIVGGAGFIGHNLALKLKSLGAKVTVLDGLTVNNLYSVKKNENNLPFPKLALKILNQRFFLLKKNKIPLKIVDARDYHKLSRAISSVKPQVIIHLAAVSHSNRSNKDPHSTFDHSLRTLENSLDNAKIKLSNLYFCLLVWFMEISRRTKLKRMIYVVP